MPMGGDGLMVTTLMWVFVAITFVFVLMRLYTRVVLVDLYAIDDHAYNMAFVSVQFACNMP
jgi:5-carboxymethyl-2-hydroxymuconate isomerase